MASKGSKKDKTEIQVLTNIDALDTVVKRIGDLARMIRKKRLDSDQQIANIQAETAEETAPQIEEYERLFATAGIFVTINKKQLFGTDENKTKTLKLSSGVINCRLTPEATKIKDVKKLIAEIQRLKLDNEFLRITPEINKEALLANQELAKTLPGVSFTQDEVIYIKPDGRNDELMKGLFKKKKKKAKKKTDSDDETE